MPSIWIGSGLLSFKWFRSARQDGLTLEIVNVAPFDDVGERAPSGHLWADPRSRRPGGPMSRDPHAHGQRPPWEFARDRFRAQRQARRPGLPTVRVVGHTQHEDQHRTTEIQDPTLRTPQPRQLGRAVNVSGWGSTASDCSRCVSPCTSTTALLCRREELSCTAASSRRGALPCPNVNVSRLFRDREWCQKFVHNGGLFEIKIDAGVLAILLH
jgi:hypothetical protein